MTQIKNKTHKNTKKNKAKGKIEVENIFDLSSLDLLHEPNDVLNSLECIDWSFSNDKTNYLSHDIHPYPAKFIPQLPNHLIRLLSMPGETVWDPFGGSGTTALESILLGRRTVSTDINPLSKIIGEAKTLTLTKEQEEILVEFSEELLLLTANKKYLAEELESFNEKIGEYTPHIPNIEKWFCRSAIDELAYLNWRISNFICSECTKLAKAAFSKSILKASNQDSETRYSCKPRNIMSGDVVVIFCKNLIKSLEKVINLGPFLGFRSAEFYTLDLRNALFFEENSKKIKENSIDLVVTSPPYPNATDYHLYHRFRIFWLGFDPRKLGSSEIGSHFLGSKPSQNILKR